MSRKISRAALRALRASIAPLAAAERAEREQKEKLAGLERVHAALVAQYTREHAPHPLDEAVRLERLAKQQTPARARKSVESDVFLTGTTIASRKAPPKAPAKF